MTGSIQTSILKAIPAFSAVFFVLLSFSPPVLFHVLLMAALVFCGLGDIAMEYDIVPGLGLFLISHILFTTDFIIHSLASTTSIHLILFSVVMILLLVYVYVYQRYLQRAEKPTELLSAVCIYAIVISLTVGSSILLWLSTSVLLGFLPFLGACFFVFSDSLIGIREFHHRFKFDEPLTMVTYYLAIFLLSLGGMVYVFQ